MAKRFAVLENDYVINVAISDYPLELNWIESDTAQIGNKYVNGEFVFSDIQIQEQIAANKAMAQQLLSATDWTATVDINDPQYSNPYLSNQPAFLAYRSALRAIAVNPSAVVGNWPIAPEEEWKYI